jgi:hypothetical protein
LVLFHNLFSKKIAQSIDVMTGITGNSLRCAAKNQGCWFVELVRFYSRLRFHESSPDAAPLPQKENEGLIEQKEAKAAKASSGSRLADHLSKNRTGFSTGAPAAWSLVGQRPQRVIVPPRFAHPAKIRDRAASPGTDLVH